MNERTSAATSSRLPLIAALLIVVAVVFFYVPHNMADPDIWWHLRDAQIQLTSHHFLTHDEFSYTAAGSPWMDHEWLAELPFYAGFTLAGARGLYFVTLGVILLIFLGLFRLAMQHSRAAGVSAFATALGVLLSTVSFAPRTLLFGWLLLVVELLLLQTSERRPRILWAMPVLFAVWVNTHGSWMIGLVLFALYVASSYFPFDRGLIRNTKRSTADLRMLALAWLTSVVALFLNPYGWRLVFYPFDMAFRQKLNIANVEEWHSLDFHTPRGRILFLILAMLFLFQLIRRRRWQLFELATLFVGLYSAFTYSRFLFLAAILLAPVLARSLAAEEDSPARFSPVIGAAVAFLLLCLVVGQMRTAKPLTTASDAFPDKALPFLAGFHPQGNVLNEYTWGGWLIWHKRDLPVFIDPRADIFEYNGTFADYIDISHLKTPLELMEKHNIRYVLFKSDHPLVYLLQHTGQWKVDYADKTATLLERTN